LNAFLFELNQPGKISNARSMDEINSQPSIFCFTGTDSVKHTEKVWDVILDSPAFTVTEKRELGLKYVDLIIERSTDIAAANKLEQSLVEKLGTGVDKNSEESASFSGKKRGAEDDNPYSRAAKLAKTGPGALPVTPAMPAPAAVIPPTAAPYAGYAPQAAAWGAYGYAGWDYSQQQQPSY
jgi:hypothetical protein